MATMVEQPEVVTAGLVSDPMLPTPYRIQRVKQETDDTFTLELLPEDSAKGFSFAPGQFNMLYVFGVGEVPISISSDPDDAPLLKHTTRVVGTVTKAMRLLKRGDTIGIRGPYGTHWPVEEAAGRDVVIAAGGIGLAPLRPALYRLMAEREKYRKIVLLYGTRTPEDMLYRHELEQWRGKFDLEIQVTVDRAASTWRGNVGVVTTMIPRAPFDPSNTLAMICGPEVMMRFTVMELLKRGVAAERVYLSGERNMKCGIGFCGHCQFGPTFVCKDGPVFAYPRIAALLGKSEV
jgi:NAD(P)H-flavin reductase